MLKDVISALRIALSKNCYCLTL